MATEQEITEFKNEISTCVAYNLQSLVFREKEWGSINFEESKEDFDRLEGLLNHFLLLPLEPLPHGLLPNFTSSLKQIVPILGRISAFTIAIPNPLGERDTLVAQLRGQVNSFFTATHIYVPYLAYQRGDVENNIKQLTVSVTKAESIVAQAKDDIEKRSSEMDVILAATREASAKAGVGVFTKDFSDEAGEHNAAANNWLKLTALLALGTLVIAITLSSIGLFSEVAKDHVVQFISSKILIILILVTATLWCGKMYKASKHMAAMNKHRANSLITFQAFVQATSDEATKNAVLLETTRSIFAITPSGLLDGQDSGSGDGNLKILEVIKHLGAKP